MKEQLTAKEIFITENHGMIYRYLKKKNLPVSEFYDVVVFGFIRAVNKYMERDDLKKYSFWSIARRAMDTDLFNHYRAQKTQKRTATVLSLDAQEDGGMTLHEMIADEADAYNNAVKSIELKETMQLFEKREQEILTLLMQGFKEHEISKQIGISFSEFSGFMSNIRMKATQLSSPIAA